MAKWIIGTRACLAVVSGLMLGAGCTDGSSESSDRAMLVLAAASLNAAMPALIEQFEARGGAEVELVLASTGNLAAQIENGAPADLFFAADEETVERLAREGQIRSESVTTYATGQLVLTWREGVEPPSELSAIGDPRFETISIANPEHAPYGAAAREALGKVGLWADLERRMVQGENVAQAYQFVQTGNADAAFVARSVLEGMSTPHLPIDPGLHSPIRQAAGILEASSHPRAAEFLEFVMSEDGQEVLAAYGFGRAAS
jgi:molybdate transport system substrate-binding protein